MAIMYISKHYEQLYLFEELLGDLFGQPLVVAVLPGIAKREDGYDERGPNALRRCCIVSDPCRRV